MGEAALQVVRTLGSAAAEESAPRPWHARTFADATVQRLSVALQRGVQEDQLLRAHVWRRRLRGARHRGVRCTDAALLERRIRSAA